MSSTTNQPIKNRAWFIVVALAGLLAVPAMFYFHGRIMKSSPDVQQQFEKLRDTPLGLSPQEFLRKIDIPVSQTQKFGRCESLALDVHPDYYADLSSGATLFVDPSTNQVVGKIFADGESEHVFLKGYEDCRSKSSSSSK